MIRITLEALGGDVGNLRGGLPMGRAYPPPRVHDHHPDSARHADEQREIDALLEENARLKELVVKLSRMVLINVIERP